MVDILKLLSLTCWFLQLKSAQIIRDTRCYLENGATASHLFASEDLKVSDTIGILAVLGDAGLNGDIELRLQEHDSPVTISPYSKNLTLARSLDKEGVDGPASVFINVICERKHTLDPGFVIPVNIRVTDANDNAPEFVNAPYVLNISEVTVVGTRVLQGVRAVDADQPGPYSTVQYAVLPGPESDYFIFVNALEGTLVLRKPLDYEFLSNFSVGIRAQDMILRVDPAPIQAVDQDVGINAPVRYAIKSGVLPFLDLNPETAEIIMTRPLLDHELGTPATVVLKATQIDNPDRYALATLLVFKEDEQGMNAKTDGQLPVKFVLKDYEANVPENTPSGSVILTTGVNKIYPNLKFWLAGATEDLERFSITHTGELILKGTLDYERRIQHSFLVHVADEKHNHTARVTVSVEDVNEWEPRFRHPRYEFHARTLRDGSIVGRLEAADGDRSDRISLSLRGPDARSFEIHDNGELILRSGNHFNGTLARLVAIASDSGKPPRNSMIPVIVHLPKTSTIPTAARATPAWLGGSVLLVAVFAAVLGLLGVVILILILYIYKHKRPKSGNSVSSLTTGYKEKSSIPTALSSTPEVLGASTLGDALDGARNHRLSTNDVDNPMYGDDNGSPFNATIKSVSSAKQISLYNRHKVGPTVNTPALSATSNIPIIGGLVQNMNDLSARTNFDTRSQNSSNYSGDPPDSLAPTWPAGSLSRRVKKLSWDDDDGMDGTVNVEGERCIGVSNTGNEKLNLTVYF